jgi:hypothetical protein
MNKFSAGDEILYGLKKGVITNKKGSWITIKLTDGTMKNVRAKSIRRKFVSPHHMAENNVIFSPRKSSPRKSSPRKSSPKKVSFLDEIKKGKALRRRSPKKRSPKYSPKKSFLDEIKKGKALRRRSPKKKSPKKYSGIDQNLVSKLSSIRKNVSPIDEDDEDNSDYFDDWENQVKYSPKKKQSPKRQINVGALSSNIKYFPKRKSPTPDSDW